MKAPYKVLKQIFGKFKYEGHVRLAKLASVKVKGHGE